MKKLLLFTSVLIFSISTFSQTPQYIPYQAVARNSAGNLLVNQAVSLRFTIHETSGTGTTDYQETQSATTNNLGLFSVNIGSGTVVSGTFAGIPWGNGVAKYTQVEIDPTGGTSYVSMGAAQMMSVPYALYAGSANAITSSALANPTGLIGMTANNGSATTAMRSDGTHAINAAIAPTWTGVHTFSSSTYSALFTGGNVGIGTSTPGVPLDVTGTGNIGIRYVISGAADGRISVGDNSGQRWSWSCGWGAGGGGAAGDFSLIHEGNSGNVLYFQNSSNNVGIGTATPAYKLDVTGTERVTSTLTVGGTATFSGSTYSALFSGGPVGIGSTAPDQALTIDGTTPIAEIRSGGYLQLRPTGNNWDMRLQATGTQLNVLSGGSLSSPIMSFLNGGDVGIDNSAPAYPLDVTGNIHTTGSVYLGSGQLFSLQRTNFLLALQSDRNLVLYDGGSAVWASGTSTSDIRTKENVVALEDVLPVIMQLSTIRFNYKKELDMGNEQHIGVIAQEIMKYFPDMVYHDTKSDRYLVYYDKLTTVLIKGMQEQQCQIEAQKHMALQQQEEISQLKSENAAFKTMKADAGDVSQLKLQVEELKQLMEKNGIRGEQ